MGLAVTPGVGVVRQVPLTFSFGGWSVPEKLVRLGRVYRASALGCGQPRHGRLCSPVRLSIP